MSFGDFLEIEARDSPLLPFFGGGRINSMDFKPGFSLLLPGGKSLLCFCDFLQDMGGTAGKGCSPGALWGTFSGVYLLRFPLHGLQIHWDFVPRLGCLRVVDLCSPSSWLLAATSGVFNSYSLHTVPLLCTGLL